MQKFFAESAYYPADDETEKQKAIEYLKFWKKNLILKLNKDSFHVVQVGEDAWIQRPAWICSMLAQNSAISLKICLEANFNYEIGKM